MRRNEFKLEIFIENDMPFAVGKQSRRLLLSTPMVEG